MPLTYLQANINDARTPDGRFDLVVNHAAAHHIAAIDRVFREICRCPSRGWLVRLLRLRGSPPQPVPAGRLGGRPGRSTGELPESLRQDLAVSAIPVMLLVDPTEAIHSELIVETFRRYFSEDQFTPLGGAVAYPLLTHNHATVRRGGHDRSGRAGSTASSRPTTPSSPRHPDSTLFAYFAGTPEEVGAGGRPSAAQRLGGGGVVARTAGVDHGGEYYDRGRALDGARRARRARSDECGRRRGWIAPLRVRARGACRRAVLVRAPSDGRRFATRSGRYGEPPGRRASSAGVAPPNGGARPVAVRTSGGRSPAARRTRRRPLGGDGRPPEHPRHEVRAAVSSAAGPMMTSVTPHRRHCDRRRPAWRRLGDRGTLLEGRARVRGQRLGTPAGGPLQRSGRARSHWAS